MTAPKRLAIATLGHRGGFTVLTEGERNIVGPTIESLTVSRPTIAGDVSAGTIAIELEQSTIEGTATIERLTGNAPIITLEN